MPFVRKTDSQGSQPQTDSRKLFIGRTDELHFFVQDILKPEEPTQNIISIWGQGGVGKTTLLSRFIDEAHSVNFQDYLLTALVDERQTTSMSIMEKFANQLHFDGEFGKALKHYKEALRTQQTDREMLQDTLVQRMPTFAGAAVEGVPFVGPLLGEGVKATTEHLMDRRNNIQRHKDTVLLEDPVHALTRAFVDELNHLAETQVLVGSRRYKKRRVVLFFDTFEQLAIEAAPWLLDYFLPADIDGNIVLVIAGRDPIERTMPDDTKRWLPYSDNRDIYWIPLNSFTEDETRAYLTKRNITDSERIATIWQLSQGLPLYLSLLTSNPRGKVDPTADVVANFLRWIPEREQIKRQLALDAALFSRSFNQDDLEAFTYLPEPEQPAFNRWLIGQPFVRPQDGRYIYHDLARELFRRHLYQHSRRGYYATRKALADHYQRLLAEIQEEHDREFYRSPEWLELMIALGYQLLLLPDEGSQIKAVEQFLKVHKHARTEQTGEIVTVLRELTQEQPANLANSKARQTARYLLQYIGDSPKSLELVAATDYLLKLVVHVPAFPTELLANIYRRRGGGYMYLKEYERAIADFDRALELDPNNIQAYLNRGRLYFGLKQYQEAIANLEHAIKLDPDNGTAYFYLGLVYRALNEHQQVIAKFDRIVELNPNSPIVYRRRGRTYSLFDEYERAIADFNRALELDPNSIGAYGSRGQAYNHFEEHQLAIADFNRILELESQSAWAYHIRGRTYLEHLKEYQRAIEDFNRTIELDPKYSWAYDGKGLAYLLLKDTKSAKANYVAGWEQDLDVTTTQLDHGWAGINCGWMAEWCEMCQERPNTHMAERLETIAATDPENLVAYACRGVAMWLSGYHENAMAELEQAIQIEPRDCDSYFWKGIICLSLGKEERAIEAIEKALEQGLPPILLTPLRWFEQDKPEFYEQYVVPLLARYDLL